MRVGKKSKVISSVSDLYDGTNVVVLGTVGQGKSILFRYLTCREVHDSKRLPLFVELRRLRERATLESLILAEAATLGFDLDSKLLSHLCQNGRVVLFLDGFDEVRLEERQALITEIEALARRYPDVPILISSRPNSGIEASSLFRVVQLAELEGQEYEEVIRRLYSDNPEGAESVIAGVRESAPQVVSLLRTPLMVGLLVFRYRVDQTIPENAIAFYSDLFSLLLVRHDRSKAGFKRQRKSGASDSRLEEFFNALAFLTRLDEKGGFTAKEMTRYAKRAVETGGGAKVEPGDALADVEEITCLLLRDGEEYRYVHRSVQEFHAASFVCDQPEEFAEKFYSSLLEKSLWLRWIQEVWFLKQLDAYRYTKYFAAPALRRLLAAVPAVLSEVGVVYAPPQASSVASRRRRPYHVFPMQAESHLAFMLCQAVWQKIDASIGKTPALAAPPSEEPTPLKDVLSAEEHAQLTIRVQEAIRDQMVALQRFVVNKDSTSHLLQLSAV